MHCNIKSQTLIFPAQYLGWQNQVRRAGDGEELGDALEQGQGDDLQPFHGAQSIRVRRVKMGLVTP